MSHTITRLFDSYTDASAAVSELERVGVPPSHISFVASNADGAHEGHDHKDKAHATAADAEKGASAGGAIGAAGGLLAGLGLLAIPGLGPVVAAGWLASTAVGALVGAVAGGAVGGLVGSLTHAGVSEQDAHLYAEGVRRGGSLVSAKVDDDKAAIADAIMNRFNHVDLARRRTAYAQDGWTSFDPAAPAYTPEQIAAERARYMSTSSLRG